MQGLGLVASRRVAAGEIVHTEEPLALHRKLDLDNLEEFIQLYTELERGWSEETKRNIFTLHHRPDSNPGRSRLIPCDNDCRRSGARLGGSVDRLH